MKEYKNLFSNLYNIKSEIVDFVNNCESLLNDKYLELSDIAQYNQIKILNAMQEEKLASTDFNWTTGYGYGDIGREKVEKIFARIFKTEDALVRPNIVSGTHAISLALRSILRHGDHLLSITSTPYDTLQKVIGIQGDDPDSLINSGIEYSEIPLINNKINISEIKKILNQTQN